MPALVRVHVEDATFSWNSKVPGARTPGPVSVTLEANPAVQMEAGDTLDFLVGDAETLTFGGISGKEWRVTARSVGNNKGITVLTVPYGHGETVRFGNSTGATIALTLS